MKDTLLCGDCAEKMRDLADNSIDAIVTDPPYGLAFMGANWDYGVPGEMYWREALRIAKPGAHLLAFGGTRTYHRLACAIEDAGWEVRDCIMWVYGCLDEESQILTLNGWKGIGEINVGDNIIGYDTATRRFLIEPCERTYLYDYDDTAYRIQSDSTEQVVSRNHRVIVERGGVEVFEYAENLAQECEARVPVLESLHGLFDDIPLLYQGAGQSQQDMFKGVCVGDSTDASEDTQGSRAEQDLSCMRKKVLRPSGMAEEGQDELLLRKLQEQSGVRSEADSVQYGTSNTHDRRAEADAPGANDWPAEPRMERRGDISQAPRQLCERAVCEVPSGVSVNGAEGRVCDGASACGSAKDRQTSCENGSRASHQSQTAGQQPGEPDAVPNEQSTQALRGARRTATTLARITPVHYKGRMWCVSVPSGAIVARRNGKIFVTGNSGFPKSMDVAKAIDKASGYEGEVIGSRIVDVGMQGGNMHAGRKQQQQQQQIRALSPEAATWNGWGTALKPACEPIVVARKPLDGTVAANVLKYGTGAINIDGCRVPVNANDDVFAKGTEAYNQNCYGKYKPMDRDYDPSVGRFPANLIHDGSDEVLALFPDTGKSGVAVRHNSGGCTFGGNSKKPPMNDMSYSDFGSAARFFYCAKASRSERGEGNVHPTVKPLALMRYLVRLVTRKGGVVLDPFMGSGTTGVAAIQEGMNFVGIERDPHYYEIATRRIAEARQIPTTATQQELPL